MAIIYSVTEREVIAFLEAEAAMARMAQEAASPEHPDKLYRMGQKDGLLFAAEAIRNGILRAKSASADTRPEGGDATEIAAPFTSGAVPSEASADAQNPSCQRSTATAGCGSSSPSVE
jgi:hypothetical protein